jgi:hypothetical protein
MASRDEIREYNRSYYQKNREHLLEKQCEKNRRFAEKRRRWLVELKKTLKCNRCEESHPAAYFTKKIQGKILKLGIL